MVRMESQESRDQLVREDLLVTPDQRAHKDLRDL